MEKYGQFGINFSVTRECNISFNFIVYGRSVYIESVNIVIYLKFQ